MKIEKIIINLQMLLKEIREYKRAAFFGVDATSEETLNLWKDYNQLRVVLKEVDLNLFGELREVLPPQPTSASSFSHYAPGAPIFSPVHFEPLRLEVEKASRYMKLIEKKIHEVGKEPLLPSNISIEVKENSTAAINIGSGNKILQNYSRIEKTLEDLKDLGVDQPDLELLKEILNQEVQGEVDRIGTGKKIMNWTINLTKKIIEKGLMDNLPQIQEKAQMLIEMI